MMLYQVRDKYMNVTSTSTWLLLHVDVLEECWMHEYDYIHKAKRNGKLAHYPST